MTQAWVQITEKKAQELFEAGKAIDVLVTPDIVDGVRVVNIRDQQFKDARLAQLLLQHIALSEIPENLATRIG